MRITRGKKPAVLAMIENFGLSASWSGNAVVDAKPDNFFKLWQKYPHTIIYPSSLLSRKGYENPELNHAVIAAGQNIPTNYYFLNKSISSDELLSNEVFLNSFDDIAKRSSALHLIGNLSDQRGRYGDVNHLLSLVKMAKSKGVYRAYIHLILDDSAVIDPSFVAQKGFFLSREIQKIGLGEVVSVVGFDFISNQVKSSKDYLRALKTILVGGGEPALTPEQALNMKGIKRSSEKVPTSIMFKGRYTCQINDFDTVVFFNHNNRDLTRFISFLIRDQSSNVRGIKKPRFLNVITFFNPFDIDIDDLKVAYKRNYKGTFPEVLANNGLKQLYISDDSRVNYLSDYFLGDELRKSPFCSVKSVSLINRSDPRAYEYEIEKMFRLLVPVLENKTADFIMIDLPVISHLIEVGSFSDVIEAVKISDKFIKVLEKLVLKNGGSLIVTSNHGGAEKMTHRDKFETLNEKTLNPIPFILTTESRELKVAPDRAKIFNEMVGAVSRSKCYDVDIAPTILDLLSIEKSASMSGESMLRKLRLN